MSITDKSLAPGPALAPDVVGAAGAGADGGTSRGLGVRDLVVRYDDEGGTTTAVDGVSLDVAPGEVVALLGPSGCGKSSLLRAVAGLEPVASGAVTWDSVDVAAVPVHQRGFGLMFQEGQLFPHRDVARNVAFGLEMARMPRGGRMRRVEELLRTVGLEGYGRRAVSTLSGGEQQRVALARALAPTPQLLLLDEPLSALDRSLRERLAADVRSALVSTGTTALFVTHDHDEAFTIADRVAVMSAGRLLRVDAPARLWRDPGSRVVAEFLGYEAFVPLDGDGGLAGALRAALATGVGGRGGATSGRVAALAAGALVVAGAAGVGGVAGSVVAAGVAGVAEPARGPRGVSRTAGGEVGAVRGVVVQVTFRRGRSEAVVDVAGAGRVTAVAPGVLGADPGDVLRLTIDPELVAVLPG